MARALASLLLTLAAMLPQQVRIPGPGGAPASSATLAFVQAAVGGGNSTAVNTAIFSSNPTVGNTICVWISWQSTTVTLSSVTDTGSNTYTLFNNPTTGNGNSAAWAVAHVSTSASSFRVTAHMSSSITTMVGAHEVSGANASTPVNLSNVKSQGFTNSPWTIIGTNVNATSGNYIMGGVSDQGVTSTYTAGGSFTINGTPSSGSFHGALENQVVSASGNVAASFTGSANSGFLVGTMALQP